MCCLSALVLNIQAAETGASVLLRYLQSRGTNCIMSQCPIPKNRLRAPDWLSGTERPSQRLWLDSLARWVELCTCPSLLCLRRRV